MSKRQNIKNFKPKFHFAIGASETIPNLTLPVHELFERLTDHTLDGIRAQSLMFGNVPVDGRMDPMDYVDQLCLSEECIDLTDRTSIIFSLNRQLEIATERQADLKKVLNKAKSSETKEDPKVESSHEVKVE